MNDGNAHTPADNAKSSPHPVWLTEPTIAVMLNAGVQYRVAVPSGRSGRITAWTVPPFDRPAHITAMNSDEILVKLIRTKAPSSTEVKKIEELITVHPTANDLNETIWFLKPCQGQMTGTLLAFDTEGTITPADMHRYVSGGYEAIAKVNEAFCTVRTAKGVVHNVRNNNLVRISYKRLRLLA